MSAEVDYSSDFYYPEYSDTSGWLDAGAPSGNSSSPSIDWNAILKNGIPRLFDLAQTSIILENGRPVVAGTQNNPRTTGGVVAAVSNQSGLILLALGAAVIFLLIRK